MATRCGSARLLGGDAAAVDVAGDEIASPMLAIDASVTVIADGG